MSTQTGPGRSIACKRGTLLAAVAAGAFLLAGCDPGSAPPAGDDEQSAQSAEASASASGEALTRTNELGPVQVRVTLRPVKPVIGDAVTLSIEVTAEKDVDVLMPEFGDALDRFGIIAFAPGAVRVDDAARSVHSQEYALEPRLSGKQSVPPILIEFVDHRPGQKASPDGEDAYELLTERLDFEVQSVMPAGAGGELRPAFGALEALPAPMSTTRRHWPWVAAVLLIAAAPFAVRAFIAYRRRARRRSAYDIARAHLARLIARPRPAPNEMDAFFVELSGIVRRYLENRFELRAPEFTTEEFLVAASRSPDFTDDHQRLLRDFLKQADLVKFAHFVPSASDIENALRLAQRFLDETRENAPLIEEPQQATPVVEVARV